MEFELVAVSQGMLLASSMYIISILHQASENLSPQFIAYRAAMVVIVEITGLDWRHC